MIIALSVLALFIAILIYLFANSKNDENNLFYKKISNLCWISYAPTNFNPKKSIYPTTSQIKEDLKILYQAGFKGIVTYGSEKSLKHIPKIAKNQGFTGVLMGIWNPTDKKEINNAIQASKYVDGYVVGHIGLNDRYSYNELLKATDYLQSTTNKPATTTERIGQYLNKDSLLVNFGDWIFPDVSLYWENKRQPKDAYRQLVEQYLLLKSKINKPVILKTVGFPTAGGAGISESAQAEFFRLLLNNVKYKEESIKFVYFEAFDQPWKQPHPVEPHWGLFRNNKKPKKAAKYIWGKIINQQIVKDQNKSHKSINWLYIISFSLVLMSMVGFILIFLYRPKDKPIEKKVPLLKIRTFGQFKIYRDNRIITTKITGRNRELLISLITQYPKAKINSLAKKVTPSHTPYSARSNFDTLLYRLRDSLEPDRQARSGGSYIISQNDLCFLNLENCRLDLEDFEKHLKKGGQLKLQNKPKEAFLEYKKAKKLYCGDFLDKENIEMFEKGTLEIILQKREQLKKYYEYLLDELSINTK